MDDDNKSRQQRRQHAMSIQHAVDETKSRIHDVIGVVVQISVDIVNSKAQVLLTDKSIPENAYARVSLAGAGTVTPLLAKVAVGDVLCIHGFRVTKHHSSKLPLVADFYSSWQEPDVGWARLYQRGEQISCENRATTERIQDLVEWFSTTAFHDSIPALPCRRRRLSELHTAGITCHVVARVVSVDTAAASTPAGSSRKRKRWLPLKRRRSTFAVLSNGNEVMSFLDCAAHEATLEAAIQSGTKVLLTNVATCAADEKSSREIVLRPTDSTSIIPMLNTETETQASYRETQCLSLTQEVPGITTSTTQTLSSPLRDVFIDELNISLGDGKFFVSPNGFVSAIIDQTGSTACYRQATLTLDGMVVKADADMMQILCGSMDPESILDHARLRTHVTDLFRGLLEEEAMLTWTLERKGNAYHVTKCFLPRL